MESLIATSEHQVLKLEGPSVVRKRLEEVEKAAATPGSNICAAQRAL